MITLTKEWLLTTIAELEEERDAVPGVVNVDAAMALAAMKLARASLEAEIHSYTFEDDPRPLYTAPPAPEVYNIGYATMRHIFTPAGITDVSDMQAVFDQIETVLAGMWQPAPVSVPDALPENDDEEGNDIDYMEPSEVYIFGRTAGWNACRAAMLQGADGTLTNEGTKKSDDSVSVFGIGSVFKPQKVSVDEVDCDNCAHYQPNVCHGEGCPAAMLQSAEQTNYRAIVERIAEIIHGKVTDIDLLTVTVKSMKDKLQK
ncbi:hypothetical protein AAD050_08570 [Enterobacter hormaechei]|uniref:hypothetical protein n=1 Tax=Enterobacter hormaechei TaxID=158836 RepID=UPI00389D903C|nr:hypothetical protein [Enterobacter hormaechei]